MTPKRRGFALIFALFVVAMIGATLVLLGRHFSIRSQTTQAAVLDVRAAQLLASGRVWVETHNVAMEQLEPEQTIELPVADLVPPAASAILRVVRDTAGTATIIASVRHGRQSCTCRAMIATPTTRPAE